jgi:hypothetical protein
VFQKRGLVLRDFLLQMSLRCYYQVLDVAQDVEQDEIRKAYRTVLREISRIRHFFWGTNAP